GAGDYGVRGAGRRSIESHGSVFADPPAGVVRDLPDDAVRIRDMPVEDASERAVLRWFDDRPSSGFHRLHSGRHIIACGHVMRHSDAVDAACRVTAQEILVKLLRVEQSEYEARRD